LPNLFFLQINILPDGHGKKAKLEIGSNMKNTQPETVSWVGFGSSPKELCPNSNSNKVLLLGSVNVVQGSAGAMVGEAMLATSTVIAGAIFE
jgi:hypothetical protein